MLHRHKVGLPSKISGVSCLNALYLKKNKLIVGVFLNSSCVHLVRIVCVYIERVCNYDLYLQQQQPFNGRLSGTTQVGRYHVSIITTIIIINTFVYRHKVVTSETLGPGSVLVSRGRRKSLVKEECFSLDWKTATKSLLRTVFGSEFQTAGAEHRKARFANVVVVKGWHSVVSWGTSHNCRTRYGTFPLSLQIITAAETLSTAQCEATALTYW